MLIKILSRKNASYSQLIHYLDREGSGVPLFWNLPVTQDHSVVQQQFTENANYRSNRTKNTLYHHVISFAPQDKEVIQEDMLHSIAQTYINKAGLDNHLVYGRIHQDKNNVHWHLMTSSNAFHSAKNFRLSKAELRELQQGMENYTQEQFPALQYSYVYTKPKQRDLHLGYSVSKAQTIPTDKEVQMQRTGRITQKEQLLQHVKTLAQSHLRATGFEQAIHKDERIDFYSYRSKTHGIIDKKTGKKYRLKTLFQTKDLRIIHRQLRSRDKAHTKEHERSR